MTGEIGGEERPPPVLLSKRACQGGADDEVEAVPLFLKEIDRVTEDMLAPYRNVDVAFRTAILVLHDGRVMSG